ncbi:MAG: phosphate ABC transporter substrate-binding/OmpA family protein [Planctomycetota bacterium]|nr:phosphate ABC transporter substrate-binding/OmpA family protein [Planctomycetota bacterium]
MAGQPKTPFYIVLFLVVAGLVAFAASRSEIFFPKADPKGGMGDIDPNVINNPVEAADTNTVTTVLEYKIKPAEALPPVSGISAYKPLKETENTVRFSLNVWAGWGPIILANNGFKPGKIWKTQDGKEFKVELVVIDNPVAMRDAYASGDIHIGWATLDMIPLFMEGFLDKLGNPRDSRVMPRVYQQIDWSNGGDGIVVRDRIKTVRDLAGQKLVLAQNSPSHYFALNMLVSGGVQPADVDMIFTEDAFQAAAAFNSQKNIAGAVSWAPDIYNLADTSGNRMLVTTATANKLIADVWFARADFANDNPAIIEALVRGIFDAMEELKNDTKKSACAALMADPSGFNIPASETIKMFADAHNTNVAENYQFFLNQNNPANFEQVWSKSYYLYRKVGSITHRPIGFDKVMDYSIIKKLSLEPKYASQRDEYKVALPPRSVSQIVEESEEILANTIVVRFYSNSSDLYHKIIKEIDGKAVEVNYDPNVDLVLKDAGALAKQFGAARIIIEGHTDASMFGQSPPELVRKLSQDRAEAVRKSLIEKYDLEPDRVNAIGYGWDRPAEEGNHAKNRRVEIKVFSAEKQ